MGKVIKVLDRGVVVSLDDEVEGFIPSAQLSLQEVKDPSSAFNQGDEIPLQVIEIDPNQRKIVLSVNAYFKKRGQVEFDEFLTKHPALSTQSIGEAMPKELKTQKESSQAVVSEAETQADSEGVPAEAVAETKTEATAETEVEPETETKGDSEADDSESKEQL